MIGKLTAAFLAAALVLFPSQQPSAEEAAYVDRIEAMQVGFMTVRRTGAITDAPGSAAGFAVEADRMQFLPDPPTTAAQIGTIFGLKFRALGRPHNAVANLRAIWRIPAPGITNPKTGNTYRQDITDFTISIGEERVRAFGFDEPWEIVRGSWTLELWQGDRKLLEQSFVIR